MSHNPIAYEITEEDVESILKRLKKHHPEKATPEYARNLLENLQEWFHLLADDGDVEMLEEFYKTLGRLKAKKK